MNDNVPLVQQLTDAFRCLPGVGPRSAQRMVWHLLERDRTGGVKLSQVLAEAMEQVQHCSACRNFSESELCNICSSERRDPTMLCVVESPADVQAIEQAATYRGYYFVTMGCLSPIDGIGPDEIGLPELGVRAEQGFSEVILALGGSVEGDATTHYIVEMLKSSSVQVSRLAQGIPVGGDLEFVDGGTLAHALQGRKTI